MLVSQQQCSLPVRLLVSSDRQLACSLEAFNGPAPGAFRCCIETSRAFLTSVCHKCGTSASFCSRKFLLGPGSGFCAKARRRLPRHQEQKGSIAAPVILGPHNILNRHRAGLQLVQMPQESFHGAAMADRIIFLGSRNHVRYRTPASCDCHSLASFNCAQKLCQARFGFSGLNDTHGHFGNRAYSITRFQRHVGHSQQECVLGAIATFPNL